MLIRSIPREQAQDDEGPDEPRRDAKTATSRAGSSLGPTTLGEAIAVGVSTTSSWPPAPAPTTGRLGSQALLLCRRPLAGFQVVQAVILVVVIFVEVELPRRQQLGVFVGVDPHVVGAGRLGIIGRLGRRR